MAQSKLHLLFKVVSHRAVAVGTVSGSQLQEHGYISWCSLTELECLTSELQVCILSSKFLKNHYHVNRASQTSH